MRRKQRPDSDDLRPEYDFDHTKAVRGKYYRRLKNEGSNIVVLEPDVAKSFRNSAAVNHALRGLLEMKRAKQRLAARPNRAKVRYPRHDAGQTEKGDDRLRSPIQSVETRPRQRMCGKKI
jgi:hypothetical protein